MTTRFHPVRGIVLGMALALALIVVGCDSSSATPTTQPTPVPTEPASASQLLESFLASPSAEATATDTTGPAVASATPAPTPTPAPTATSAATPTPAPSTAPSAAATAAATNGCTGTADNKAFFADARGLARFPVYCAVLPSDWWLQTAAYDRSSKMLMAAYLNGRDFVAQLLEGQICDGECTFASEFDTGRKIWLGDLGAYLYYIPGAMPVIAQPTATPPLTLDSMGLFLAVAPYSKTTSYAFIGAGMSLGTFTKLAKAVIRVP